MHENLELHAMALGENPNRLAKRLQEARRSLRWDYARYFTEAQVSFERKQLIGSWGYYLQWQTREHPQEPISPDNPQSEGGFVQLCRVAPDAIVGISGKGLNSGSGLYRGYPHVYR